MSRWEGGGGRGGILKIFRGKAHFCKHPVHCMIYVYKVCVNGSMQTSRCSAINPLNPSQKVDSVLSFRDGSGILSGKDHEFKATYIHPQPPLPPSLPSPLLPPSLSPSFPHSQPPSFASTYTTSSQTKPSYPITEFEIQGKCFPDFFVISHIPLIFLSLSPFVCMATMSVS